MQGWGRWVFPQPANGSASDLWDRPDDLGVKAWRAKSLTYLQDALKLGDLDALGSLMMHYSMGPNVDPDPYWDYVYTTMMWNVNCEVRRKPSHIGYLKASGNRVFEKLSEAQREAAAKEISSLSAHFPKCP
jgi:hypothetical protein